MLKYFFLFKLAHPILKSLDGTPHKWLADLLHAFNSGDLGKFESLRPQWQGQADLAKKQDHLMRKIRLLCLMELAFARPANQYEKKIFLYRSRI